ncbi:MAG: glucose-6-phosphate dehydrogenase (NADP(+)) [Spirochaetia bacterium]|nr:glucose-6-phosphate dehydrogenase (NADP(+)) [Spirochaetia bacterium]
MKQIIIQFGGTGDLFKKKLLPAYMHLAAKGYDFSIITLGRRFSTREEFIAHLPQQPDQEFLKRLEYVQYDMKDPASLERVSSKAQQLVGDECEVEFIYYIALQPSLYEAAIRQIEQINTHMHCTVSKKIIVEKPFGFDLDTATAYNTILTSVFTDEEIYRIDHYLGKEFMQNLLIMRFHNDIIRGIWNNHFIDHIQIIFDEDLGVEERLGFYEQIGVVRDTVQNHILQVITHLTMSEPSAFTPEEISHEKLRVLRAIKPVKDFTLSRYRSLAELQGDSIRTPTYTSFKLFVDTFEFSGVPIYVRTGKMQSEGRSQIYVNFKNTMGRVLNNSRIAQNSVIITTHPEMNIDITLNMKMPNTRWETQPVRFNFNHAETFGINTPEAYEQIVEKILRSDKSLFPSMSEIQEAWRIVTPTLQGNVVETYDDHTLPASAVRLLEEDGRVWNA